MRPSLTRRVTTATGLGLLFVLVYNLTGLLSRGRPEASQVCLIWEGLIPFIPSMILPYVALDLFFMAAPFLTRSIAELNQLAGRLTTAIVLGGCGFILIPLKFGLGRPPASGWAGQWIDTMTQLDPSGNFAPSLHVAISVILATTYLKHTRLFWRGSVVAWFTLTAASTVLTREHHLFDALLGMCLGFACLWLWPAGSVQRYPANQRLARRYGAAAAALFLLATALPEGALLPRCLLYWAFVSTAIWTAAHAGLRLRLVDKYLGRLTVATWIISGPVLFASILVRKWLARGIQPYHRLSPYLFLGRRLTTAEAGQFVAQQPRSLSILDVTEECSEARALAGSRYCSVPMRDLTLPTEEQLTRAVLALDHALKSGPVYLHCALGLSRSPLVAAAWLCHTGRTADAAATFVEAARPGAFIDRAFLDRWLAAGSMPVFLRGSIA